MFVVFLACTLLPPAGAEEGSAAHSYALDPAQGRIYAQVFRDDAAAGSDLSHDHVILATGWKGSVVLDPAEISACRFGVDLPVSGLQPDLPELRTLVGYASMLTEPQRAQVAEHMLGASQLDAERFPEIRFRGAGCTGSLEALSVPGKLSIHGVTKDVVLPLAVTEDWEGLSARGSLTITHQDFGLEPYEAFFGALKNRADIRITVDVKGTAK